MIRQHRKLHKWTGIILGIPLLMWTITGIVACIGHFLPYPSIQQGKTKLISENELQSLSLSPYDALESMDNALWEKNQIQSLTLRRIDNVILYEFTLGGGKKYTINANSGLPFKITSEVAQRIARDSFCKEASVLNVTLLNRHSYFFPYYEPLPAYKVEFDDDLHTNIYISPANGNILRANNRWNRLLLVNQDLHLFGFIRKLIINNGKIQALSQIIVALTTGFVFISGYYLALRKYRRL